MYISAFRRRIHIGRGRILFILVGKVLSGTSDRRISRRYRFHAFLLLSSVRSQQKTMVVPDTYEGYSYEEILFIDGSSCVVYVEFCTRHYYHT